LVLIVRYITGPCKSHIASRVQIGIKDCEVVSLPLGMWDDLPSMRVSRVNFNPCEYKGFVYLCGYGAFLMEAFEPQISRFLPVLTVILAWNSQSLMFVEGGQLVVISDRHISRLNWVEGSCMRQTEQIEHD